jgi:PAS domain-containing protein
MDDMQEHLAAVDEELRVADEELRAQQELIDGLLRGRSAEQLAGLRLAAALPVPLIETDRDGLVLRANPAAVIMLQVDAVRLRGKPLVSYVQPADRRVVRTALSRAAAEDRIGHLTIAVRPRGLDPVRVDAVVLPASDPGPGGPGSTAARWVLAPRAEPETVVEADLLTSLGALATVSVVDGDLQAALGRLTELAVRGIGPATAASLLIGPPAEPMALVSTDRDAQAADGAQFTAAQGPTWDAYAGGRPVTAADLGTDPRWPAVAGASGGPAAGTTVVALPMAAGDGAPAGVLVLYGKLGLDEPVLVRRAAVFAEAATALLREHSALADLRRQEGQLRDALTSRAAIDQAKGILMGRLGLDADAAFAELTRMSQRRNVKLREVARQLVAEVARPSAVPSRDS